MEFTAEVPGTRWKGTGDGRKALSSTRVRRPLAFVDDLKPVHRVGERCGGGARSANHESENESAARLIGRLDPETRVPSRTFAIQRFYTTFAAK